MPCISDNPWFQAFFALTLFLLVVALLPLAVFDAVCHRPDAIHQRASGR
jgi:hypothetical protein